MPESRTASNDSFNAINSYTVRSIWLLQVLLFQLFVKSLNLNLKPEVHGVMGWREWAGSADITSTEGSQGRGLVLTVSSLQFSLPRVMASSCDSENWVIHHVKCWDLLYSPFTDWRYHVRFTNMYLICIDLPTFGCLSCLLCKFQINRAPSFGTDQKIDYDVKRGVLLNALKLLNIR
jgi:hypothetical protein